MNRQLQLRQRELAKIHIAKQQLGMEDDAYRAMLKEVAGVDSSAKLSPEGRGKVLDHLTRIGFQERSAGRPNNLSGTPQLKKIEALLADAARPWKYAEAMADRMYGKKRLAFCDSTELGGIITALTRDAQRHGRRTE